MNGAALGGIKKGDKIAKLLDIGGRECVAICTVAAVCKKRGLVSTDESHVAKPADIEADGVSTYRLWDGRSVANYLPGCSSRLVRLDG